MSTGRVMPGVLVFDDVRENAVRMAMFADLASEDPARVPRTQRDVFPVDQETGDPLRRPECQAPERSSAEDR